METENKQLTNKEVLDFINGKYSEDENKNSSFSIPLSQSEIQDLKQSGFPVNDDIKAVNEENKSNKDLNNLNRENIEFDKNIIPPVFLQKTNSIIFNVDNVKITDDEKEKYLRCVLDDKPLELTIHMNCKDVSFNVAFKSKYVFEQELLQTYIYNCIINKELHIDDDITVRLFKASLALILKSINGKEISNKDITHNTTDEEFKKEIEFRISKFNQMQQHLFTLISNAACDFEQKQKLLAEFLVNQDFS